MSGRLLAVSWAMPPMVFPRSIQVARSLSALRALGWNSAVVCSEPLHDWTADPALEARYKDSYETIRVSSAPRFGSTVLRFLGRPRDAEADWIEAACRAATSHLLRGSYDALITFAQPWSDHLIGLRVARRTGLPWIAHFSDPWSDSPYLAASPAGQLEIVRVAERRVIDAADAVVFPTQRMADLVMAKFPIEWREKAAVVPHGFETERAEAPAAGARSRCRFLHAGDFYGIRSPAPLLEAVALLRRDGMRDMEVVFVGLVPDEYRAKAVELGIGDSIRFLGRLTYTEAAREIAASDALLVVDAPLDGSVFLPSKLVDYLAFSRPIVGITPRRGASAELLERMGFDTAPPDNVDAVAALLGRTVAAWRSGELSVPAVFHAVAGEYAIERTTQRLMDAVVQAIGRKGVRAA